MRYFMFDKYNSWYDWRLTLTAKEVAPPEPKTNYVQLDGMSGSLDLSEALTGEVAYNDRTIKASFWTSEGTASDRVALLRDIRAALHGRKVQIIEPDDPEHFFWGRLTVRPGAHDMVHDEFDIEAVCEPWRYAVAESVRTVQVAGAVDVVIRNGGEKTLCPEITVDGAVTLTFGGATVDLSDGTFRVAGIRLRQGVNVVGVSGTGTVAFRYREAAL